MAHNNVSFHPMKLEKEDQIKPKAIRKTGITKISPECNKIRNKNNREINETKSWFFDTIKKKKRKIKEKLEKPLATLTQGGKKKRSHKLPLSLQNLQILKG